MRILVGNKEFEVCSHIHKKLHDSENESYFVHGLDTPQGSSPSLGKRENGDTTLILIRGSPQVLKKQYKNYTTCC